MAHRPPRIESHIQRRTPTRHDRRQSGAAIVTALLVVSLATLVVAGLFYRENVTVRSVENRLALAQTHWIERGVLEWTKVVLMVDQRQSGGAAVDHLQESWAQPILDTRLDETVTAGATIGDSSRSAMLAGQIFDAQARLNLNNMVLGNDANAQLQNQKALRKLLDLTGQPSSLADTLLARLRAAYPPPVSGKAVKPTALPLIRVADLRLLGFDDGVIAAIEPYVIFLPAITTVNLNTAEAIVIAAAIDDLDLEVARRFVAQTRRQYARVVDAQPALNRSATLPPNMVGVNSSFFIVRGVVRYDRVEAQTETLMQRQSDKVDIVWQQRS